MSCLLFLQSVTDLSGVVLVVKPSAARVLLQYSIASFPGLHAQLLSLATNTGRGGLGTRLVQHSYRLLYICMCSGWAYI